MEAWLRKQPREVSVAFAARAALRALPIVGEARGRGFKGDFLAETVLPVFRATGVAWAGAKYPAQATDYAAAAARTAAPLAAPSGAGGAAVVAAAAAALADTASAAARVAAARAVSDAFESDVFGSIARSAAARVAATRQATRTDAANAAAAAIGVAARAFADARFVRIGIASDTISANAAAPLWSAVSIDARRAEEEGRTASDIAGSQLWPQYLFGTEPLQSLWQETKAALIAEEQDWQVWINWYEDRLAGHVRGEERELAYVRIKEALWKQGPAIVNAEIKRRIDELEPIRPVVVQTQARISSSTSMSAGASLSVAEPAISAVPVDNPPIAGAATQHYPEIIAAWQSADAALQTPHRGRQYVPDVLVNPVALADTPPAPIENVPSAVSFGWTSKTTITVVASPENWPAFPFKGGEKDHEDRLDACRVLATDAARSLRSGKWNARSDYAETLDQYVAYLPKHPVEGNFLLADAKARIIRSLFAAEQDFLAAPFAAELKVLLEQHIGLRAYYPATAEFYESVRSGHLETPLPIDAIEGFIQGVRDNTPTLFEQNVADTLQDVAQPLPRISKFDSGFGRNIPAQPVPPPDPLGEVDPEKARRFTLASIFNALWKVFLLGEIVGKAVDGWSKAKATLGPFAAQLIEYLRSNLPGGGN